jgi:tetratricopeptide (TPR) repeat protein
LHKKNGVTKPNVLSERLFAKHFLKFEPFLLSLTKKSMKKLFVIFTVMLGSLGAAAQAIKTPAPSPTQTIKQDFALSSIEVVYSRPSAKGRTIFGDLVPFGKIWRTGANAATKITFGEDVKVGGTPLKAGSYALYTVPNKDEWEIIINKGANNSGLTGYKTEDDVARFKVKSQGLPFAIETLTIMLNDATPTSINVAVLWGTQMAAFPVVADIDSRIMSQINTAMTVDSRPYFQAASYYFETGKDLNKALEWANKAIETQPKAFWILHLKAKIQAKSGDKAGAKATALKSIELSKEAKNDDYVTLNEKLIATL